MKKNVVRNVQEAPSHFRCPISFEVMEDPVILSSGITYERASIEKWLGAGNKVCPVTRQALQTPELMIPNHTLSHLITSWHDSSTSIKIHNTLGVPPLHLEVFGNLDDSNMQGSLLRQLSRCPSDHHIWKRAASSEKLWNVLLTCLKGSHDQTSQEDALAVMNNIYICKLGGSIKWSISADELSTIATFLHVDGSKALRGNATRMLLCMASSEESPELRVRVASVKGLVEGLVRVLRNRNSNRDEDVAALRCILSVCCCSSGLVPQVVLSRNRLEAIECGVTGVVVRLLLTSQRQQQGRQGSMVKGVEEEALEVLKTMATCAEGREALAKDHATAVPAILECLLCTRNMSAVASEHGIVTLWYLICHSCCSCLRDVEKTFVRAGGLSTMIMVLHCHCSPLTKHRAGELLKHFAWLWK